MNEDEITQRILDRIIPARLDTARAFFCARYPELKPSGENPTVVFSFPDKTGESPITDETEATLRYLWPDVIIVRFQFPETEL